MAEMKKHVAQEHPEMVASTIQRRDNLCRRCGRPFYDKTKRVEHQKSCDVKYVEKRAEDDYEAQGEDQDEAEDDYEAQGEDQDEDEVEDDYEAQGEDKMKMKLKARMSSHENGLRVLF